MEPINAYHLAASQSLSGNAAHNLRTTSNDRSTPSQGHDDYRNVDAEILDFIWNTPTVTDKPGCFHRSGSNAGPDSPSGVYRNNSTGGQTRPPVRPRSSTTSSIDLASEGKPFHCWDHGCNGRSFSCSSNYHRHCREKHAAHKKVECPLCGQQFSRLEARHVHLRKDRCKALRGEIEPAVTPMPMSLAETASSMAVFPVQDMYRVDVDMGTGRC